MEKEVEITTVEVTTKICTGCTLEKPLEEFGFLTKEHIKRRPACKVCAKLSKQKWNKDNADHVKLSKQKWDKDNADYIRGYTKYYREDNKEKLNEDIAIYRIENKDEIALTASKYYENNGDNIQRQRKKRRENDPLYKLIGSLRNLTSGAFTENGYEKDSHTYEILGCSYEDAMAHIERLWSLPQNLDANGNVWMNWGNYGKYKKKTFFYGWDIDHRIAISAGSGSMEMTLILSRIKNLQPLCSHTNRDIKRNKFIVCEKTMK